ncbi:MAG: 4-hydroxy-3-methylbut-2-enyl diphosphate reductase, partial [Burkholderiaceae bacterium]|nr:4-hydroxy-3-methylbut-2-enyl diphosphate reductase [Burkholderiaceae bacterium]
MQSNPLPSETDEILLAQPRGFCAGVDRAINIVNEALT